MTNSSHALRVLVIDDEPLIRWSLAETLAGRGYIVAEAADAAAARRIVADPGQHPDVVLLDYRLPDSNDLGLLRSIRDAVPDAQIIVMTAYGTPEMAKSALDMGVYCVVGKPFEVDDLADLVSQAHAAAR